MIKSGYSIVKILPGMGRIPGNIIVYRICKNKKPFFGGTFYLSHIISTIDFDFFYGSHYAKFISNRI